MPSVAFVSSDWGVIDGNMVANGCTHYRCILPARALAARGWDNYCGAPALDAEYGLGLAKDGGALTGFDTLVSKLLMHRHMPPIIHEMSRLGTFMVVDVDDFHAGLSAHNVARAMTDPHQNPDSNRAWYEQGIRAADRVTVSTDFLGNYYAARCRDVVVVRNGIDAERYPVRDLSGEPILGWVGATPWRSEDIETVASWLPLLVHDTGLKVHHSGHIEADPFPFAVRAGLSDVSTSGMVVLPDYPTMFQPFNIGIVPLNLIPFNEAKSTIKGLEYAASGIPFVAAPTYEYKRLADMGVGRIAHTPDEWRDHVLDLMDEQTRIAEGARIRELVLAEHTYEARGDEWDTALSG